MAGRLISPPVQIGVNSIEPLSGPRSINSGATESIGNFLQTFSSPFGLWRFRFSFHAMKGEAFRRYRGWITALHGGANATRWHFFDPDMMLPHEVGFDVPHRWDWTSSELVAYWSNGEPFENGEPWRVSAPQVAVGQAAVKGATTIRLANQHWGHHLGYGDYIGFFPFHFGMYMITKADILDPGVYTIWPPLRKEISGATDYATLNPTLAMRLESEEAASAGRGLQVADALSVTMVEVEDAIVKEWFIE